MTMPAAPAEPQFVADFGDQTAIFDPSKVSETVTVIGCGGIGASILPTLVTMGFTKFVLWDDDIVVDRNVTTNLIFRPKDLGKFKVDRVKEYLLEYGATSVEIHKEPFSGQQQLTGLVISGVDSMKARQMIWQHVANGDVTLYMDGRIGGQNATLLALEPFNFDHTEWYEKHWLFDDDKAAPLPCTARTIVYPAVSLGVYMAAYLAAWSRGEPYPQQTTLGFQGEPYFEVVYIGDNN
jgi:hypothetical protein